MAHSAIWYEMGARPKLAPGEWWCTSEVDSHFGYVIRGAKHSATAAVLAAEKFAEAFQEMIAFSVRVASALENESVLDYTCERADKCPESSDGLTSDVLAKWTAAIAKDGDALDCPACDDATAEAVAGNLCGDSETETKTETESLSPPDLSSGTETGQPAGPGDSEAPRTEPDQSGGVGDSEAPRTEPDQSGGVGVAESGHGSAN